MVETDGERKEYEKFEAVIKHALFLKSSMLDVGYTRTTTKCPRCNGWIFARLKGKKNHIHMACDGKCGMSVME